jgi:uncharacterized protein YggE
MLVIHFAAVRPEPGAALGMVTESSTKFAALLDRLDIDHEKRHTQSATVAPKAEWDDGRYVNVGFQALHTTVLTLDDPAPLGRVIREAVELGANINGPHWHISSDNPARAVACRIAAADAKRRAEAYAQGVGVRLGLVESINETDTSRRGRNWGRDLVLDATPGPSHAELEIELPELNVSARVEIAFRIER